MKKTLFVLLPVSALFLILSAFYSGNSIENIPSGQSEGFFIPEDVSAILNDKCFGCHNMESTADKAKEKLLIDELDKLSKAKLVAKLVEIGDILEKNEMPPAKFLEKYPDKALTKDESTRLKDWTTAASDDLMK